jgi:hypothetical protein
MKVSMHLKPDYKITSVGSSLLLKQRSFQQLNQRNECFLQDIMFTNLPLKWQKKFQMKMNKIKMYNLKYNLA